MLEIVFAVLAVAVMALLVFAHLQPAEFRVSRSARFAVPASAIFPHVNNLTLWQAWSPWAKLDPNAQTSFEGPEAGVGAKMSWSGNNKVGVGSMAITDSRADELITFQLDFVKPFQATHHAEFAFQSADGQTSVTWTMTGRNNFVGKVMGLVMNCDKMIGGQFEQGLASLQAVVTTAA